MPGWRTSPSLLPLPVVEEAGRPPLLDALPWSMTGRCGLTRQRPSVVEYRTRTTAVKVNALLDAPISCSTPPSPRWLSSTPPCSASGSPSHPIRLVRSPARRLLQSGSTPRSSLHHLDSSRQTTFSMRLDTRYIENTEAKISNTGPPCPTEMQPIRAQSLFLDVGTTKRGRIQG